VISLSTKPAKKNLPQSNSPEIMQLVYYRHFTANQESPKRFNTDFISTSLSNQETDKNKNKNENISIPPPPLLPRPSGDKELGEDVQVYIVSILKNEKEKSLSQLLFPSISDKELIKVFDDEETHLNVSSNVNDSQSIVQNASFCSELMTWGLDSCSSMGVFGNQEEAIYEPRLLALDRIISLERVAIIACSTRHTILLTQYGTIFSCGENTEGALGVGDFISRFG
jgi:hypothetical protein